MIRLDENNELVMEGAVKEVVTEFGDIVSQYCRYMWETHPEIGKAAENTLLASMIFAGAGELPIPDKKNMEEMNENMIPMVKEIQKSLEVPREFIRKRWGLEK